MELLVFGHAGARTLVFPTREGRFFDYENWGLVEALRPAIEQGHLQLFCVDSVDSESLYCRRCPAPDRLERHKRYERYILEEVLPFSQDRNSNPFAIAHGCSIGAYHSVNLAFRHPQRFGKVVGLSGRYDLTRPTGSFRDLFEGYYDDDVYFHTPPHYIARLTDRRALEALRRLDITFAVGHEDPFFPGNRELSGVLHGKAIGHTLRVWDGEAHRASAWRQMVRWYL